MKKLILICLLIAFTTSAHIGETINDCIKRYGKPIKDRGKILEFYFNGYDIKAFFINGKCEYIRYEQLLTTIKLGRDRRKRRLKINNDELKLFMKANRLNGWKLIKQGWIPKTIWYNRKANLTANYGCTIEDHTFRQVDLYGAESFKDYFFDIYSKKYEDYTKNQKKIADKLKAKAEADKIKRDALIEARRIKQLKENFRGF